MSLASKSSTYVELPGSNTSSLLCGHLSMEPDREAVEVQGNLRGVVFHEYIVGADPDGYIWACIENTKSSGGSTGFLTPIVMKIIVFADGSIGATIDPNSIQIQGTIDGWQIRDERIRAWVDHVPNESGDIFVRNPDLQWRKPCQDQSS
jgi:hypothetical protein